MIKIRTTILLLGVLALYAVTIASSLDEETDSSSQESSETGVQELWEMCNNNNASNATFLELMETFQSATNCSAAAIDLAGFMSEVKTLSKKTRTTFFPRYCPQLQTACNCIDKLVNNLQPCTEEEEFIFLKKFASVLPKAVELICKNDGEILFEFGEPKFAKCFENVSDNFDECITFLNGMEQNGQCSQLSNFRLCLKDKFTNVTDIVSVYDIFHYTLFHKTPCRNYVNILKLKVSLTTLIYCRNNVI